MEILTQIAAVLIALFISYSLWRALNWARILVLIVATATLFGTVASLFSGLSPAPVYSPQWFLWILERPFSIIWIIYLTRPAVIAFFKKGAISAESRAP